MVIAVASCMEDNTFVVDTTVCHVGRAAVIEPTLENLTVECYTLVDTVDAWLRSPYLSDQLLLAMLARRISSIEKCQTRRGSPLLVSHVPRVASQAVVHLEMVSHLMTSSFLWHCWC